MGRYNELNRAAELRVGLLEERIVGEVRLKAFGRPVCSQRPDACCRRRGFGYWPHAVRAICRQSAAANGIGRGGGGDSRQQSTADRPASR